MHRVTEVERLTRVVDEQDQQIRILEMKLQSEKLKHAKKLMLAVRHSAEEAYKSVVSF